MYVCVVIRFAVHQYDLEHGVEVRQGTRLSWIIWFQDAGACAPSGKESWHVTAAEAGAFPYHP